MAQTPANLNQPPIDVEVASQKSGKWTIADAFAKWFAAITTVASWAVSGALSAASLQLTLPVPSAPMAGTRYQGAGAEHFIRSTTLTGAPQAIALPGDTRFAYIVARLRHVRSVNNGVNLWLRFNGDSGANYNWSLWLTDTSAGSVARGAAGAAQIALLSAQGVDNTATKGYSGACMIVDPGDAIHHKMVDFVSGFRQTAAANDISIKGSGFYVATPPVPIISLQLLWSDGSNFAEGICDLYGILAT